MVEIGFTYGRHGEQICQGSHLYVFAFAGTYRGNIANRLLMLSEISLREHHPLFDVVAPIRPSSEVEEVFEAHAALEDYKGFIEMAFALHNRHIILYGLGLGRYGNGIIMDKLIDDLDLVPGDGLMAVPDEKMRKCRRLDKSLESTDEDTRIGWMQNFVREKIDAKL